MIESVGSRNAPFVNLTEPTCMCFCGCKKPPSRTVTFKITAGNPTETATITGPMCEKCFKANVKNAIAFKAYEAPPSLCVV
jgi:hypothetical protein